ncbi:MAG TPA: outer membrane protein assembly factor BamE [Usitatibacter sp.]|nr:outer membrane protein assembly factor BamE [Usitatibacter sp.]
MKRSHRLAAMALFSVMSSVSSIASPTQSSLADASEAAAKFLIHVTPRRVTEEAVQKIHQGMTRAEVRNLIGEPMRTTSFPRTHTISWDYDWRDGWGYDAELAVVFDEAGIVVSRISIRHDA